MVSAMLSSGICRKSLLVLEIVSTCAWDACRQDEKKAGAYGTGDAANRRVRRVWGARAARGDACGSDRGRPVPIRRVRTPRTPRETWIRLHQSRE